MPKWEYFVKERSARTESVIMDWLDELGEQGWELICVRDDYYFFKRPKQ